MRCRHGTERLRRLVTVAVIGLSAVAAAGCSGDAASIEPTSAQAPDAGQTRDFMRAYTAGRQSAPVRSSHGELAGVERDFAQGHGEVLQTPLRDVATFIASGEADAWLHARYASLTLAPDALPSANVLLFVTGWEAVSGERASAPQAQGLVRQMAASVAAGNHSTPDARRQQRILELLSASIAREARRLEAEGDPTALARFRDGIALDFQRQSGNDLTRFNLAAEGFVPR